MKSIRLLLVLQFLLLGPGAFAATASGQVQDGPKPNLSAVHVAASDAEKTLNRVLRASEKDANLLEFVLHTPWYKPRAEKGYVGYSSKHFLSATMAERELPDALGYFLLYIEEKVLVGILGRGPTTRPCATWPS